MINILSLLLSSVLWVQVPQWSDDWSKCAVDVPDASCHWYITAPDNTFGEGLIGPAPPGLTQMAWVMSLVLTNKLLLKNFNLSSTVFKAVRRYIKSLYSNTF